VSSAVAYTGPDIRQQVLMGIGVAPATTTPVRPASPQGALRAGARPGRDAAVAARNLKTDQTDPRLIPLRQMISSSARSRAIPRACRCCRSARPAVREVRRRGRGNGAAAKRSCSSHRRTPALFTYPTISGQSQPAMRLIKLSRDARSLRAPAWTAAAVAAFLTDLACFHDGNLVI